MPDIIDLQTNAQGQYIRINIEISLPFTSTTVGQPMSNNGINVLIDRAPFKGLQHKNKIISEVDEKMSVNLIHPILLNHKPYYKIDQATVDMLPENKSNSLTLELLLDRICCWYQVLYKTLPAICIDKGALNPKLIKNIYLYGLIYNKEEKMITTCMRLVR